jgi:glycosyltransferase involved in cell wall biosynthesis
VKVALVIPALRQGGAESMIVTLANGLCERGWTVSLVTLADDAVSPLRGRLKPGVQRIAIGSQPYSLVGVARFVALARRHGWDVIMHHLTPTLLHGMAAVATGAAKHLVYVEHSPLMRPPSRPTARERLVGPLYRWCQRIVCVSNFVRDGYIGRFFPGLSGRAVTIHNGVDVHRIASAVEDVDAPAQRARWHIPHGRQVAAVIGRLAPVKGHAELLSALGRLSPAARSAGPMFLFVGDGPARADLQGLVTELGLADDTRFSGGLDNVAEALAIADVVVIPSRWEGLPMVALEAMSAARPVVAVAVGGVAEVVTPESGLLVPPGDHDRLVMEALSLLEKPIEVRRALGIAGQRRAEGMFGLRSMIDRYDALLREVAVPE